MRISEFAYGTEKAKEFFSQIMEQAKNEYNFNQENAPMIIEANPIDTNNIILIISKYE